MVKPVGPIAVGTAPVQQREIRDVHTLVAKLASEVVTLQSWTEQPPADTVDAKIQQTISGFASDLADDAGRIAGSLDTEQPQPGAKVPGTGLAIDRSV